MECSVDGCVKVARSKVPGAVCPMHYMRMRTRGSYDLPEKAPPTPVAPRACAWCGRLGVRVRYCSDSCQLTAQQARQQPSVDIFVRDCRYCSEPFVARRGGAPRVACRAEECQRKLRAGYWKQMEPDEGDYPAFLAALKSNVHETPDGCWLWLGVLHRAGYGRWKGRLAHRVSYEAHRGPIPDGLVVDHLCGHKACVRPEHLEAVTVAENSRRGASQARSGKCPRGHARVGRNVLPDGGCRKCHNLRGRVRTNPHHVQAVLDLAAADSDYRERLLAGLMALQESEA